MKSKLVILFLIVSLFLTTGLGCKGGDPTAKKALLEPVVLNFWGFFDSSDVFKQAINNYKLTHPNVVINYKKLRFEDYEQKLLEGWANGEGPDIFVMHNTWVRSYENKILPLPEKVKLPVIEVSGVLKKEQKAVLKEFSTLTPEKIKALFPDVVYNDGVKNNKIYGLPLSMDTLALFYNRDHFNAAGIIEAPITWQEFNEMVKKLTILSGEGEIMRAGAAIGGADNINRSNDILSLLMMQNGTTMVDDNKSISFASSIGNNRQIYPGEQALKFYTDFALPAKEVYTWNSKLPEAMEMFSSGKLSLMFGFAYQIPLIKAQAPKVNLGIAEVPHLNPDKTDALGLPINLASYWLYTVFKNSPHTDEAWDFLVFLTTKQYTDENGKTKYYAEDYLTGSSNPPALRNLLANFKNQKPELAPFANQILTAVSWYRGRNPNEMNKIFKQMITQVISGKVSAHSQHPIRDALSSAASAIEKTY